MFSIVNTTFEYGPNTVQIEMGEIARQASASVKLDMDGTVILCAVVGKKTMRPGQAFFPLTVNYQEKTYAAGKIPGGFFRREARPSESETLIARLVDRPIRPLFPEGFMNDVQVVITVMSLNPEVSTDIAAMLAASAALAASGLPFSGPIAAARVGYINNEYVLNPALSQMEESQLDLVVAGTDNAVLMVESEADELAEDVMLGAVVYGHKQMAVAIDAIKEFAEAVGTEPWDWKADEKDAELSEKVKGLAEDKITAAYQIADKMERYGALGAVAEEVVAAVNPDPEAENAYALDDIKGEIKSLEKNIVRSRVIAGEPRIDGRDSTTVRDIDVQVGVLPRTHGSALFTRGETQAIVVTTLGSARDMQIIDSLTGEYKEHFMLHYNFPPYCVGETGMMGSPKRREIGHGNLARRGIRAVMPAYEDFPYTIRVVSEITESNGSSSMASVCGCSLSMMDAGVPLKAPVAGIAMGLVKEGDDFAVLTDILGDEDHLGDMDFKVAGTRNGVSTLQMDIKIDGISPEIMQQALEQAHAARIHILDQMDAVIAESRTEVSQHAPKMLSMTIHKDKIRDVIGKGGETIRGITEETGATVDINDDGELTITAVSGEAAEAAKAIIEGIVEDPEVGKMYTGPVVKILENIGALVEILPKKSGLVHKSQVSDEFIDDVAKFLKEGDVVTVKLLGIDRGKYRLTMKGIDQPNIDSLPQAGATTDSESDDSVGNS